MLRVLVLKGVGCNEGVACLGIIEGVSTSRPWGYGDFEVWNGVGLEPPNPKP